MICRQTMSCLLNQVNFFHSPHHNSEFCAPKLFTCGPFVTNTSCSFIHVQLHSNIIFALTIRRSNHSSISHSQLHTRPNIHSARPHSHLARSHPLLGTSHTQPTRFHQRLSRPHPQQDLIHPHASRSHPHSEISPQPTTSHLTLSDIILTLQVSIASIFSLL